MEAKEIESLSKDSEILFFFLKSRLDIQDAGKIQKQLSDMTGKKVILLDATFEDKILSI